MLIRFNVKNYKSFSENSEGYSEEFSMIAGKVRNKKEHIYDDGKVKLLKFAAVYGANAAGKSNLVKALRFMQCVVVKGLPEGHIESYCKSDMSNKKKPSYFEIELKLEDKYFAYGFEVVLSESRFISEWLYEIHDDNTQEILFERDIEDGTYEFGGVLENKELLEKLNIYAGDISDDNSVLFLSVMNQNKRKLYEENPDGVVIKKVFDWMMRSLDINYPNQPISDYSYLATAETNKVKEVCELINTFGTGITDIKMEEVAIEKVLSEIPRPIREKISKDIEKKMAETNAEETNADSLEPKIHLVMRSNKNFFIVKSAQDDIKCETIKFSHGNSVDVLFDLAEESDGTVRVLDLLEILLAGEGKTYVIDELDRCLHPCLTYKFIESFFEFSRKKNIQLIVTTHESRLMDFDLLRRDEIWFVDKDVNGKSSIYSLEEYNTRFDQKVDKAYLEGRYGGVPVFTTIFPIKEE